MTSHGYEGCACNVFSIPLSNISKNEIVQNNKNASKMQSLNFIIKETE